MTEVKLMPQTSMISFKNCCFCCKKVKISIKVIYHSFIVLKVIPIAIFERELVLKYHTLVNTV